MTDADRLYLAGLSLLTAGAGLVIGTAAGHWTLGVLAVAALAGAVGGLLCHVFAPMEDR